MGVLVAGIAWPGAWGDARADGPTAPAALDRGDGFEAFCGQWMRKLAERERTNLAGAEFRKQGDVVVAEYTGYAKEPVRCESRVARPGAPGVGVLVYHEVRYRRRGADRAAARVSEPQVIDRVEVTEVFRYDGASWSY